MTAARDAGINDVIAKPVSAGAIERKLKSLLLAPRPFVTAKAFVGPDRRGSGERRNFGPRPTAGEDRKPSLVIESGCVPTCWIES